MRAAAARATAFWGAVGAALAALVPAGPAMATLAGDATEDRSGAAAETGPGDPYAGLSPSLLRLFTAGRERFIHEFSPEEGLGPVYNETACQTCHGGAGGIPGGPDALGLGSIHNVKHVGLDQMGFYDALPDFGGPMLIRQSIANDGYAQCTIHPEAVPAIANVLSIRNTPAVLGFGLIDAIPDEQILARQNLGVDGIHGVANWGIELEVVDDAPNPLVPMVQDFGPPRVGRFGWKAQTATLEQFSAEPLSAELGISNRYFPQEHTDKGLRFVAHLPNSCNSALPPGCPSRAGSGGPGLGQRSECLAVAPDDPDASEARALYHFQALLAPPSPLARGPQADAGAEGFRRAGCANCHVPEAHTASEYHMRLDDGRSIRVPQLEGRTFYPYSDFLLHDMGPGLADSEGRNVGGIQGRARGNQWRTTPLWGLRLKASYLHDGRTNDVGAAVLAHGGEARVARDRWREMTPESRDAVLAFLGTL